MRTDGLKLPNPPRNRPPSDCAFTLVELLVVIGVLAILLGMLLPVISRAREQGMLVACKSNLNQIALATRMYANLFDDKYPDSWTLGGAPFRRGPGEINPADPYSAPEIYGMPALYDQLKLLRNATGVWLCPAAGEKMHSYKNTYVWATFTGIPANYRSRQRGNPSRLETFWVYDNFANEPFRTGARRGSEPLPLIPTNLWRFPHSYRGKVVVARDTGTTAGRRGAINCLFLDGHVGMVLYVQNPNAAPGTAPKAVVLRGE